MVEQQIDRDIRRTLQLYQREVITLLETVNKLRDVINRSNVKAVLDAAPAEIVATLKAEADRSPWSDEEWDAVEFRFGAVYWQQYPAGMTEEEMAADWAETLRRGKQAYRDGVEAIRWYFEQRSTAE